jgi:hypothetical protein
MSSPRRKLDETEENTRSAKRRKVGDASSRETAKKLRREIEDKAAPIQVVVLPKDTVFKVLQLKEPEPVIQAREALHKAIAAYKKDIRESRFSLLLSTSSLPPPHIRALLIFLSDFLYIRSYRQSGRLIRKSRRSSPSCSSCQRT